MHKPATAARYSRALRLTVPRPVKPGIALAILMALAGCARARPPTQLAGPPQTNAADRALARLTALAWATFDELDPVTRDEVGVASPPPAWPPATPAAREAIRARLDPVRRQIAQIDPEALSPRWRAAKTLLERRLDWRPPAWDAYALQALVGRGLWASLGPEALPAARSLDRLDALGSFLMKARTATVATTRERLVAAAVMLDDHRAWVGSLAAPEPDLAFINRRDLAVAALDVQEDQIQVDLVTDTSTAPVPAWQPWGGRWRAPPTPAGIAEAAETVLARIQKELLALVDRSPAADTPRLRADAIAGAAAPEGATEPLGAFLERVPELLEAECPPPPTLTASTAPEGLRGLAAVRLDELRAFTSTDSYRLWVSPTVDDAVSRAYPPPKRMALALFEGWPGRALQSWATATRADRGATERRWRDPVLAAGWPLFALDRLLRREALRPAVRWEVAMLLLRAVVDAQVDLRARLDADADDRELLQWLLDVGRQSRAEARYKLSVVRVEPGRLSAPFVGWWTLSRLADAHLANADTSTMRRFAACTEWPPDLLPVCLRHED